jgi:hypothetical protein
VDDKEEGRRSRGLKTLSGDFGRKEPKIGAKILDTVSEVSGEN